MSVAVTPGPATDFGLPRELFQTPLQSPLLITAQYVATGNGERFLLAVPVRTTTAPITVVLDWTKLLRR